MIDDQDLRLRWAPPHTLSCWYAEDGLLHAAVSRPDAMYTLCYDVVTTPIGWANPHEPGLAVVIPYNIAAKYPPPKPGGGTWELCLTCLEESIEQGE